MLSASDDKVLAASERMVAALHTQTVQNWSTAGQGHLALGPLRARLPADMTSSQVEWFPHGVANSFFGFPMKSRRSCSRREREHKIEVGS